MRLNWGRSLASTTMPGTTRTTPPPADAVVGATGHATELSTGRAYSVETARIDTDTTNTIEMNGSNESEMYAQIPPTHNDCNRTATHSTDADAVAAVERGRQGPPAPRLLAPLAPVIGSRSVYSTAK